MVQKNKTGYLEVLLLNELSESSRTGYELMDLLQKKMHSRPSPGSVYPLLKKMHSSKLISVSVDGRKKIYSLTALGKKVLEEKMNEKKFMITEHVNLFRTMIRTNICLKHPSLNIVNAYKVSKKISPETTKLLLELKEKIIDAVLDESYSKNEKKFNSEIKETIAKLKSISNNK